MRKITGVTAHDAYGTIDMTYDDGKVVRVYKEALRNIFQSFTYLESVLDEPGISAEDKVKAVNSFVRTHSRLQDMGFGALTTVTADDQSMSLFCRESDPTGEKTAFVFGVIAHFRHGPGYEPVAGEFSTHS